MTPLADAQDRRDAVFTPDNAIVWASAGTGKTHTLILRTLRTLLELAGTDLFAPDRRRRTRAAAASIRSLLLITFTRKAAAEMQARLCQYVDRLLSQGDGSSPTDGDDLFRQVIDERLNQCGGWDRFRAGVQALSEHLTDLQVSTIHSYAAALLRRYPLEAGLPADCRAAREDEDEVSDLEDRLIRAWWRGPGFRDPGLAPAVQSLLDLMPRSQIDDWLRAVARFPWVLDRLPDLRRADPAATAAALAALQGLARVLPTITGNKHHRVGLELQQILQAGPPWNRLRHFISEQDGYLFPPKNQGLQAAVQDFDAEAREYITNLPRLRNIIQAQALADLDPAWSGLQQLLRAFSEWRIGAGVRELRLISFDDLVHRAVDLLNRHPRVADEERRRLRAVLVDEFQDTDPLQLELLKHLLESVSGADAARAFLVGDTKQSIYRFRGADVTSVEGFCTEYSGSPKIRVDRFHLRTTFRCGPAIAAFVNRYFAVREPLAVTDSSQLTAADGRIAEVPQWILIESPDQERALAAEKRDRMARTVAAMVRERTDANPGKPTRRYRDFLVLGRTYSDLGPIIDRLQNAGIPAVSSGTRTFFRNPEVLDVVSLLIALLNPLDGVGVAATLRSPVVGMDDPSLGRILREIGPRGVMASSALPSWLPPVFAERIEELRRLAESRVRLDPGVWISRVVRMVPKTLYLRSGDWEGRAIARIDRLIRSFAQILQTAEQPALSWLLEQRKRAATADSFQADLGEDVALTDEALDAVRVMTVHKAKGLEGKVVIICGWNDLAEEAKRRDEAVLDLATPKERRREFRLPFAGDSVFTPGYADLVLVNRQQEAEERVRLAYVAATRAREELLLLHPLEAGSPDPPDLEKLRNQLGETVRFVRRPPDPEAPPLRQVGANLPDLNLYRRAWDPGNPRFRESGPLLHHPSADGQYDGDGPEAETAAGVAGTLGTGRLVHTYLEHCLHRLEFEPSRFRVLAGASARPSDLDRATSILEAFFDGSTGDESGRPLVERVRSAKILGREVPVLLKSEGRTWHGIIDLLLEEEDAVRGIDYKTGHRHTADLPAGYQRQRSVYSEALARLFPNRETAFEFWWLGG